MKRFLYIILAALLVFLPSCDDQKTTTAKSSVAKLSGFTFAKNDSMPGLAKAVFTIEERLDTGLVWNKDSMLYGTSLEKVVPKFTFAATPGSAYLHTTDTLCALTGYDTLNFTKQPIYLTIRSADSKNTKTYEICPTVHKVDPDLYSWTQITDTIYPLDDSEQRVVRFNDLFVMITSNGFDLNVYASDDAEDWTDLGDPIGLPDGTRVRQIISTGDCLFYAQENFVYTSDDAVTWIGHPVSFFVETMIFYWNNEVWALVDNNGQELAIWRENDLALTGLKPEDDEFPVSDFATVCFNSSSERERAMVIGGFAENGRSLNTRWNFEYSRHIPDNSGYRIQEFSIDRPKFSNITGASVIWYNNQLMMFGGVDENMKYFGRDILISKDEGLNWTLADTTKNQLPEAYQARQKQNTIVLNNNIYLFGGQDAVHTYSDVYRGHLNSIDW